MAAGDVTFFHEFAADLGNGTHDFDNDTFKVALITSAVVPTAADSSPALGDYTEVTAGGQYVAGGSDISATWSQTSGVATFDGNNITWTLDISNPNNARYGILYNDTASGDPAIAFVDLGGTVDMTTQDANIDWDANGIYRIDVT